jgi:predicted permease
MLSLLNRIRLWLRTVLFGRRLDREMREEMAAHLARSTADGIARGLSPEEASRAARLEFGHLESLHEDGREARGARGLESLIADIRIGLRHLRRTPLSSLTMVVVLALGIGFNSAIFVVVTSLLNSMPAGMTHQESLVRIRGIDRSQFGGRAIGREFSYPEYREYDAQRDLFSATAAWTSSDAVLDVGTRDEHLLSGAATYVTSRYFHVLGLTPVAGVGLPADVRDEDPAAPLVGVISDALWNRHYRRSPAVVGATIKVNGVPITIVGVAPRRFAGARSGGSQIRVWLPLAARAHVQKTTDPVLTSYDFPIFGVIARLAPSATVDDTPAVVRVIAQRATLQATRPVPEEAWSTDVVPLTAGNYFPPPGGESDGPGAGRFFTLLIPLLVLVITCTNVSALLAGQAVARRREVAVRLALGASRWRVVRQFLTETVLLATAAGALALLVIFVLIRLFDASIPDVNIVVDWRGTLFTFVLAGVTGLLFGIAPALHATRLAVAAAIKDAGGLAVATRTRLQAGLVVAQIAFTQPALIGMGSLLLEVTDELQRGPSIEHADRILDVRFNTNPRYGRLDEHRERAIRRVEARLGQLPGIASVVPQENLDDYFEVDVHPEDRVDTAERTHLEVRAQGVPSRYFAAMDIPIISGQVFGDENTSDVVPMVISADLARRLWGPLDPIGRRFRAAPNARGMVRFTVVGVVDEARAGPSGRADGDQRIYVPHRRRVTGHLLVRTHGPAQPVMQAVRSAALSEAPDHPLVSVRSLAMIQADQRRSMTNAAAGVGGSGLIALFLSAIGLYAVVSFAVGQRVREIGIRTALGADRRRVVGLFLFRGLRLSLAGLGLGLALSVSVVHLMAVSRGETPAPATWGLAVVIAGVVVLVALVASWMPARRAAQVDPLEALRTE